MRIMGNKMEAALVWAGDKNLSADRLVMLSVAAQAWPRGP